MMPKNVTILEHAILKGAFLIDTDIYMLPINLSWTLEKTASYNNKFLILL